MITRNRIIILCTALVLSLGLGIQGCYYDIEEELYPGGQNCNPDEFTFSGRVYPIMEDYCLSCHSQAQGSGGIVLEGYLNVRNESVNGTLLCSIKHEGCANMPDGGGKLSDCDINAIQKWVDNGAPEN